MEIKHFDHEHLLSLRNRKRDDEIRCDSCSGICDGPTYICSQGCSDYGLCESCGKLPKDVQSPFDPQHLLTLQRRGYGVRCHICGVYSSLKFFFHCAECKLELDVECALMRPVKVVEDGDGQGQPHSNFIHHHPLLPVENMCYNRFLCSVCGEYCSDPDPTYGCIPCLLFLHGSCFERELPLEIQHLHHPHTLSLCTERTQRVWCKACDNEFPPQVWCYNCKTCNFVMDIDCTLSPTTISDNTSESQIQHFLHEHPLSLLENELNDQSVVYCFVCGKSCTGLTTYVCSRRRKGRFCRKIYCHKSCLELPQQICHPFHPYHPLTLTVPQGQSRRTCNACRKSFRAVRPYSLEVAYICQDHKCEFLLHIYCSTVMMSAITYEGHGHLLQFGDGIFESNTLTCSACASYICESCAFTCLYCGYNLHFECGPLPYTIQHKCHIDPLVLTHSPVEEEKEDDTYEFYCDACEEERDYLLPIYHCAECHYVAQIKCVISEVILSLKGQYGDVELRSTFGHTGKLICGKTAEEMVQNKEQVKTTMTLYDILKSWSLDDIGQLDSVLKDGAKENGIVKEDDCDEKGYVREAFLFSDKAYTRFMKALDKGAKIPEPFKIVGNVPEVISKWAPKEEVASVRDYMIPMRLAPILRQLLSKYGDISVMSTLSPKVKMYLFYILCECMYSMIITKVVDITQDLLLYWWTNLKILQFAKFKIQFAFDHLKRVAHAYLGLCVRKEVDNALDKTDKDIKALKDKRKALKDKYKCIIAAESAKSSLIEECLREASILRHGKAGTFFLYR